MKSPGAMPDWVLVLSPLALTVCFLINPDQFAGVDFWAESLLG
jgi:hypothetical protein